MFKATCNLSARRRACITHSRNRLHNAPSDHFLAESCGTSCLRLDAIAMENVRTNAVIVRQGVCLSVEQLYIASETPKSNFQMCHASLPGNSRGDDPMVTSMQRARKPLKLFLQEMLRFVARLEIDMHICPLNVRQAFQFDLQLLSYVVRSP